jgi:Leucine Rich repeat
MAFRLTRGLCLALVLAAAGCAAKPDSASPPGKAEPASINKPPANYAAPTANASQPPVAANAAVESPADRVTRLGGKIEREGSTVTRIDFFGTQIGDADLKVVSSFPELQSLGLSGTKVTDAGLSELMGLAKLHTLSLTFTDVTDKGLFTLAKLPELQNVDLLRTKATGAGIAELQKALPRLNISK